MLAVRVSGRGTIGVRDVESATGDGLRVKVVSAGICGSDLHVVDLGFPAVTIGHEVAGLLDDGTAVAIEPVAACGQCDGCRAGHEQRCREILQRIYGMALDGGMADEIVVVQDGRIVAHGSHEELLEESSLYAEIVEKGLPDQVFLTRKPAERETAGL